MKAARNSAIGCAILLAVIEGVGIGIQRMMAENTRLDVRCLSFLSPDLRRILTKCNLVGSTAATSASSGRYAVGYDSLKTSHLTAFTSKLRLHALSLLLHSATILNESPYSGGNPPLWLDYFGKA